MLFGGLPEFARIRRMSKRDARHSLVPRAGSLCRVSPDPTEVGA